ncbi:MAG TPA: hypothetical protein VE690_19415 [Rhodopila sp.]|nr:hypothetical protein [Rhodopila sp.]
MSEIIHLFVDDGSLALALVGWCAAAGVGVALLPGLGVVSGLVLFLGCALILLANVALAGRGR